jgi:Putative amidase domain
MSATIALVAGSIAPLHASAFDAVNRLETVEAAKNLIDAPMMFENDCTYFVSQSLWLGGMPGSPDWTPRSSDQSKLASHSPIYDPGPTKAAANADYFKNYMVDSDKATITRITWSDNTAHGAQLADVIAYDWNGRADGVIDHIAMVTAFTDDGYPLVSQHSPTRLNRGWSWDPDANKWIEFSHPGSRAYLIHFT